MNKRRAKKDACHVVSRLILSYLECGQPDNDCQDHIYGWTEEDEEKLHTAFEEIQREMERRAAPMEEV